MQELMIPHHLIGAGSEPPRVAIVGGWHGEELNGLFVLSRLADLLRRAAAGEHPKYQLRRRVLLVPELLGVADGPQDSLLQQLTAATLPATFRIELRSNDPDLEHLPHVQLVDSAQEEREGAFLFGLPAIVEQVGSALSGVAVHCPGWKDVYGESYFVHGGQRARLELAHCHSLFQGLLRFLLHRDLLLGEPPAEDEDPHLFLEGRLVSLEAEAPGLFVSHLNVGRWVLVGETLGHLYDAFDGTLIESLKAPVAGLVSALRRQPMAQVGDPLVQIRGQG